MKSGQSSHCVVSAIKSLNLVSAFTTLAPRIKMLRVKTHNRIRLPLLISLGSLFFLSIIVIFTDPVQNALWAVLFFLGLSVFLISLANLIFIAQGRELSRGPRRATILLICFIVISLMLRSAGALSLSGLAVLVLVVLGAGFYFSRF